MKPTILSFAVLLSLPLVLHAGQQADQQAPTAPSTPPDMAAQAATTHVVLQDADLKWGEAPPAFERGARFAVLSGDPGKAGLFVIRIRMPPGFKVANHWHPSDEHVTLLDGDASLQMDDSAQSQTLSSGAYVLLPARMHHAVSTKGGATVQVMAMGPFELTYVDPRDDPRKRAP